MIIDCHAMPPPPLIAGDPEYLLVEEVVERSHPVLEQEFVSMVEGHSGGVVTLNHTLHLSGQPRGRILPPFIT